MGGKVRKDNFRGAAKAAIIIAVNGTVSGMPDGRGGEDRNAELPEVTDEENKTGKSS